MCVWVKPAIPALPLAAPAPGLSARPVGGWRLEHQGAKWGAGGREDGLACTKKAVKPWPTQPAWCTLSLEIPI